MRSLSRRAWRHAFLVRFLATSAAPLLSQGVVLGGTVSPLQLDDGQEQSLPKHDEEQHRLIRAEKLPSSARVDASGSAALQQRKSQLSGMPATISSLNKVASGALGPLAILPVTGQYISDWNPSPTSASSQQRHYMLQFRSDGKVFGSSSTSTPSLALVQAPIQGEWSARSKTVDWKEFWSEGKVVKMQGTLVYMGNQTTTMVLQYGETDSDGNRQESGSTSLKSLDVSPVPVIGIKGCVKLVFQSSRPAAEESLLHDAFMAALSDLTGVSETYTSVFVEKEAFVAVGTRASKPRPNVRNNGSQLAASTEPPAFSNQNTSVSVDTTDTTGNSELARATKANSSTEPQSSQLSNSKFRFAPSTSAASFSTVDTDSDTDIDSDREGDDDSDDSEMESLMDVARKKTQQEQEQEQEQKKDPWLSVWAKGSRLSNAALVRPSGSTNAFKVQYQIDLQTAGKATPDNLFAKVTMASLGFRNTMTVSDRITKKFAAVFANSPLAFVKAEDPDPVYLPSDPEAAVAPLEALGATASASPSGSDVSSQSSSRSSSSSSSTLSPVLDPTNSSATSAGWAASSWFTAPASSASATHVASSVSGSAGVSTSGSASMTASELMRQQDATIVASALKDHAENAEDTNELVVVQNESAKSGCSTISLSSPSVATWLLVQTAAAAAVAAAADPSRR